MSEPVNLGRLAYVTFRNLLGWRDKDEELVPKFEELSPEERNAWDVVVDVICDKYDDLHPPIEAMQTQHQMSAPVQSESVSRPSLSTRTQGKK